MIVWDQSRYHRIFHPNNYPMPKLKAKSAAFVIDYLKKHYFKKGGNVYPFWNVNGANFLINHEHASQIFDFIQEHFEDVDYEFQHGMLKVVLLNLYSSEYRQMFYEEKREREAEIRWLESME